MAGHQVDLVTLQVILFVGNWFLSWGMIAYNSWCLAQGDDGHADMVNAAPVTVLVMGLFMTNLQGFLAWFGLSMCMFQSHQNGQVPFRFTLQNQPSRSKGTLIGLSCYFAFERNPICWMPWF